MRRKRLPPPPPTPDGHVLVTFENADGTTVLAPRANEDVEADSAARVERSTVPLWWEDPAYSWRRGKR